MTFNIRPYFEVLRNRDFTKLWFTQLCTQLTRYILSFAVILQTFKLTDSSLAVSFILVAFGLATLVFGSLAGVYADRFDKRKLLIIITFGQALLIFCYIPFEQSFVAMAVITFLYSSFNQFYLPAEAPAIPHLVEKENLLIANSFFSFTANLSLIAGFAIAGPLTLTFGTQGPYWATGVLMLLAGVAAIGLPSLKPKEDHPHKAYYFKNVWGEFKEGLREVASSKKLHYPFTSLVAVQVYNGMIITIAPAFVSEILALNLEQGTLFMIAPIAIGILVGTLFLGLEGQYFSKKQMIRTGFFGLGLFSLLIAMLVRADNYWLYVILAFILGLFNTYIFAPSHSMVQSLTDERIRGRVYATLFLLLQLGATLPTVIIGVLADFTSVSTILGGLGVVLVGFSLVLNSKPDPIIEVS